jgi:anti-anti-sigma factor
MSRLSIERRDGVIVARPNQDVDAAVVASMRDELAASVGSEGAGVILDLAQTRYVDSAGLDMIFRLGERLARSRSALVLVIPAGSQLERLAAIVALPQAVHVEGTLEQALEALREMLQTPSPPEAPQPADPAPRGCAPRT